MTGQREHLALSHRLINVQVSWYRWWDLNPQVEGLKPSKQFLRLLRMPFRHTGMVASEGLEPSILSEYGPQPYAYANSATSALKLCKTSQRWICLDWLQISPYQLDHWLALT